MISERLQDTEDWSNAENQLCHHRNKLYSHIYYIYIDPLNAALLR